MSDSILNEDQMVAASTLSGRVLVTAGAGSGKTRVLTERAVNAVRPGTISGWKPVSIDEVLAITYTEKAAGELASRVRASLRGAGVEDQARRVDAAWISTIHGMCARILRAEALEAGIDPAFRVLETVETGELRERALETAVMQVIAKQGHSKLLGAYDFSQVAMTIFSLAEDMRNGGVTAEDLSLGPVESACELAAEAVCFFEERARYFETCGLDTRAVHDHGGSCSSTLALLRDISRAEILPDELAEAMWNALKQHSVPRTSKGVEDEISSIRHARRDLCSRFASVILRPLLVELVNMVEAYHREFAALKLDVGGVDFSDLQVETRRLLQRPEVLERWRKKFALVMVDEFQDTDSLQLEIVEALAGENFCTVGDERQSIYRFRGADVGVYRDHNDRMIAAGGTAAVLSCNYRSHPEVLRFVNRLFGHPLLFGEDLVRLGHGRSEPQPALLPEDEPRVQVVIAPQKGKTGGSEARYAIAAEIARRIEELRTTHHVPLGDIVILLPTYGHANEYATALTALDVEAIVVGGSRFFSQREVCALRTALRVVVNTLDEAAVAELLASDLCGLSDDGLLELRRRAKGERLGLWGALERAELSDDDHSRVATLARAVTRATAAQGRVSLSEMILRLVEDCGLDLRLLASGLEGGQGYANVLKLSRLAAAFEDSQGSGPAAFLAYLDSKERFGDRETPAALTGDDSEAVRIMSIHASKGLEFPVVFVPELASTGRTDRTIARWSKGGEWTVAMALSSSWTEANNRQLGWPPEYDRLYTEAREAEEEERKRLFYVACTRARELLVLAGAQTTGTSKSRNMLNWLLDVMGATVSPDTEVRIDMGGEAKVGFRVLPYASEGEGPEGMTTPPSDGCGRTGNDEWFAVLAQEDSVDPHLTETPRRLSYSGIQLYQQCPLRFRAEKVLGMGAMLDAGPAMRRGSALHALLQIAGEDSVIAQLRLEAVARHYRLDSTDALRVESACEAYRASTVAEEVRTATTVKREAPFALWVGDPDTGFLLDGTIDVYARKGEHALIVDYKTGESAYSAEELSKQFGWQARCYALAAVRDQAKTVEAVFVRPEALIAGEPQTIRFSFSAEQVEESVAEMAEVHARMMSGKWGHRAQWDERTCTECPVLPQMCKLKATQWEGVASA